MRASDCRWAVLNCAAQELAARTEVEMFVREVCALQPDPSPRPVLGPGCVPRALSTPLCPHRPAGVWSKHSHEHTRPRPMPSRPRPGAASSAMRTCAQPRLCRCSVHVRCRPRACMRGRRCVACACALRRRRFNRSSWASRKRTTTALWRRCARGRVQGAAQSRVHCPSARSRAAALAPPLASAGPKAVSAWAAMALSLANTSAPHLHQDRDWARPCHICAGTGLAAATLHRDWARHRCIGRGGSFGQQRACSV
jgi:hypothetical protein